MTRTNREERSHLDDILGLLAMIMCSICSIMHYFLISLSEPPRPRNRSRGSRPLLLDDTHKSNRNRGLGARHMGRRGGRAEGVGRQGMHLSSSPLVRPPSATLLSVGLTMTKRLGLRRGEASTSHLAQPHTQGIFAQTARQDILIYKIGPLTVR